MLEFINKLPIRNYDDQLEAARKGGGITDLVFFVQHLNQL